MRGEFSEIFLFGYESVWMAICIAGQAAFSEDVFTI